MISVYSNENELVLDNAVGSCSTGIATINIKIKFIGIEKEKKYFEIAVNKIKEHKNFRKLEIIDNSI